MVRPPAVVKCIVVGDVAVGKSTLCASLVRNSFTPIESSTVGVDFFSLSTPTVTLQLWDSAGNERFHSITEQYYRNAKLAILCWSCAQEATLQTLVDVWVPQVREKAPTALIVVFGLKADLVNFDEKIRCARLQRNHVSGACHYGIISSKEIHASRNTLARVAEKCVSEPVGVFHEQLRTAGRVRFEDDTVPLLDVSVSLSEYLGTQNRRVQKKNCC